MSSRYDVGQVLYVISKKERRVYPVLVVEEIVRKTLNGAETSYIVQLPDKKSTTFPLEAVTDTPFSSAAEIREHLIRTASESISTMVQEAEALPRPLRLLRSWTLPRRVRQCSSTCPTGQRRASESHSPVHLMLM
jgi:hypothetical protein